MVKFNNKNNMWNNINNNYRNNNYSENDNKNNIYLIFVLIINNNINKE